MSTLEAEVMEPAQPSLRSRWDALREAQPRLRIRDAATQLGVSELQLLLTEAADEVIRLDGASGAIVKALEGAGRVMTLTRNETVVHETKGEIRDLDVAEDGRMGLCLGAIDLRLFFSRWAHAYAVRQAHGGGRDSLQFFDAAGGALMKIYRLDEAAGARWAAIVDRFRAAEQRPAITWAPPPARVERRAPADVDALLADWAQITDVHQFIELLRKHRTDRLSALDAADPQWTQRLPVDAVERALRLAAERAQPIMVFVGNAGGVQIYTGVVQNLMRTGPWFNVMDESFNLHANTAAIVDCRLVRRPSEDGDIHSLECFDAHGELVLTLFGERKPGVPELQGWRQLLRDLAHA